MPNTEPRETPTASAGAVKIIAASAAAIVVVLIVLKQLDFTPSKVVTHGMSVEFQSKNGGVAPPTGEAAQKNAEDLEKKVRQLEEQLREGRGANAATGPTSPASIAAAPDPGRPVASPAAVAAPPVNINGVWRSPVFNLQFTQVGTGVTMQVFIAGMLSAAGEGTLSGNNLQVSYVNYSGVPGRMTGTISPDGSRLDATDYGKGYPEPIVFVR